MIKLTALVRHANLDSMTLAFPDVSRSDVAVNCLEWIFNITVTVIRLASGLEVTRAYLNSTKN